jgi:hypothetical protein
MDYSPMRFALTSGFSLGWYASKAFLGMPQEAAGGRGGRFSL